MNATFWASQGGSIVRTVILSLVCLLGVAASVRAAEDAVITETVESDQPGNPWR
jgi:hypothetical protein